MIEKTLPAFPKALPEDGPHGFIVPLSELGKSDLALFGGKAKNLGELCRAGFPVPDGFCVTTIAYAQVVRSAESALAGILDKLTAETATAEELGGLALAARKALLQAEVPAEIRTACAAAYAALGQGRPVAVAVRSSATAEDLPDASFAGQQDTYLNIVGEAEVLAAIRRCWASLFTERAVLYRHRNRIDSRAAALAVVVQRLIPAEVAGVLFTADPLSGRRGVAVIDASPGLGEAVVSGAVNPDHFELDASGKLLLMRPGDKRVAIVPAGPAGGTKRVEGPAQPAPCLSIEEARALAELGRRVEAHYGEPQDLEFALGPGRQIFLLQARPITTLFPLPKPSPLDPSEPLADGLRVYFNGNVLQGVFRPMTPMGISAWFHLISGVHTLLGTTPPDPEAPPMATAAALRLFADATPLVRSDIGRRLLSFALARVEARSVAMFEVLFRDPRLPLVRTSRFWLFSRLLRAAVRTRAPLRILQALLFPEAARARAQAAGDEILRLGEVKTEASAAELLETVEGMLGKAVGKTFLSNAPVFGTGLVCLLLVRRLLAELATRQEVDTVLRALPHNPTTEMDLQLFLLSRRLRQDPAVTARLGSRSADPAQGTPTDPRVLAKEFHSGTLPASLQTSLASFLEIYGARGVAEIDLGMPRWREDPTHLLGSLMNYLAMPETASAAHPDPEQKLRQGEKEAAAMIEELGQRATRRSRLRGALVRFLLSRVRELSGMREAPKFYMVRVLGRARQLLQQVGETLHRAGRLTQADGIFFLSLAEARRALGGADLRELEQERRKTYARELLRRHLPRVLLSDGSEPQAGTGTAAEKGAHLQGTPASAGQVTGVARVILDPEGAQLLPGEILVAPSTDPGWTPLFLTAGGLVMEMGGAMSHGAVVAREYGIPAVVGLAGATERIHTGDRIHVDGLSGVVRPAAG